MCTLHFNVHSCHLIYQCSCRKMKCLCIVINHWLSKLKSSTVLIPDLVAVPPKLETECTNTRGWAYLYIVKVELYKRWQPKNSPPRPEQAQANALFGSVNISFPIYTVQLFLYTSPHNSVISLTNDRKANTIILLKYNHLKRNRHQ